MYVCICRQITDKQIREYCAGGDVSMADVRADLGLASDCGRCGKYAREIVAETVSAANLKDVAYAA
ncbi:MAG: (2Fe-2S)-binding protein [Gammaproteobacteria bacterium]|nr:(2Fe-2S)-binding protein [Gammaproteobacteria bacterium]|tara:strand:- start:6698 stop:6895 length:198 start_codon:yes stop_codon:yes gene_type:complete